jgi:glutamyl-tRNA synthetase
MEDLHWFGLRWDEGPDVGGPYAPYRQSERRAFYFAAWQKLRAGGFIYPCSCSRRDVLEAAGAPHHENDEPIYPGTCRPSSGGVAAAKTPDGFHWRFRVPERAILTFLDGNLGKQTATAGHDFGDFVVWRKDDTPAYQLAVVVDDAAMQISEVVRGADLLTSTFRQLLLYEALVLEPPRFYHAPLVLDSLGQRLAKRHASLSLRALRAAAKRPEELRA